jgi:hypothetical protein
VGDKSVFSILTWPISVFVVAFLIGVGAAGWVVAEGVAAGCCLSAGSLAWVVLRVGGGGVAEVAKVGGTRGRFVVLGSEGTSQVVEVLVVVVEHEVWGADVRGLSAALVGWIHHTILGVFGDASLIRCSLSLVHALCSVWVWS